MTSKRKGEGLNASPIKRPRQDDMRRPSNQHPEASLLGIPVEIRLKVYEHLFGDRLLHITTRPCKPYEKGAFRPNALLPSWGPLSRAWKKWTHTVCQVPDDWNRAYKLSKQNDAEEPQSPRKTDDVPETPRGTDLPDYYTRHDACSWIQDDFQDRKYNYACSHRHEFGHRPHFCIEQEDHDRKLTELYGQPEDGLERCHQESKLHLHILIVCRDIYHEAALLPYQTNIFNFDYPATMQDFVAQALQQRQSAAIKSLHTGSWRKSDLLIATKLLPSLQYLQYNGDCGDCMSPMRIIPRVQKHLETGEEGAQIKKVEAIYSFNDATAYSRRQSKAERRDQAELLERLLMNGP